MPTKTSRHRIHSLALWALVLLALAGAGWWAWRQGVDFTKIAGAMGEARTRPDRSKQSMVPVPVHTALASRRDFPTYLNGLGTVQAWNTVTVRSRVDGQVEKISFQEGQPVREGDVLVELDARPFQAALDQATDKITQDQANLASASADLARTSALVGNGYATKQLFDQQTANVNQLKALIKADEAAEQNAKVSLGYTTITAPISGHVGLRTIDIGNIVHPTDQGGIVTIEQIQPIAVVFTAPEDRLPDINRGLKGGPLQLTALTPDGSRELAHGTLSIISNEIDVGSGTIRLKGQFENADSALWPGLSVTTRLLVSTLHDVVVIPESAVQRGPEGLFTFVVGQNFKVEKRDIKVGPMDNGDAVIEAGLEPGEQVVTSGQYRVEPGAIVAVETQSEEHTATRQPARQVE
jgi:membrane fusion protein, multidrug efflux system